MPQGLYRGARNRDVTPAKPPACRAPLGLHTPSRTTAPTRVRFQELCGIGGYLRATRGGDRRRGVGFEPASSRARATAPTTLRRRHGHKPMVCACLAAQHRCKCASMLRYPHLVPIMGYYVQCCGRVGTERRGGRSGRIRIYHRPIPMHSPCRAVSVTAVLDTRWSLTRCH